jgi:Thioesterase-like superfamily
MSPTTVTSVTRGDAAFDRPPAAPGLDGEITSRGPPGPAVIVRACLTAPVISELDEDTTGVPRPDGGFDLVLADRWGIGGGRLNGGYQLAAALRPLGTLMAARGRPDPVVASASFLRPAVPGPAHLATTVHRVGRRLATGSAQLLQPGPDGDHREVLRLEASFGDLAATAADRWDGEEAPRLPPPQECVDLFAGTDLRTDAIVIGRVVFRVPTLPGWRRREPSGDPTAEFWVSFSDGSDATLSSLAFVVDCATPVVVELGRRLSSTAQLTVQLREHPAPGPLACRVRTRHLAHGLHEEDFDVWDSTGVLCAQSRQLAVLGDA